MSSNINQCYKCESLDTYNMYVGNRAVRVCGGHANEILIAQANKGIEPFVKTLIMNYDRPSVLSIATQVYQESDVNAELNKYDELIPMFTYGILRIPVNIEADGGSAIVTGASVKGHVMYAVGGRSFPVTKETGNSDDLIYGTYFEIPRYVITSSYDITEGFDPSAEPDYNMYNRRIVSVTLPNGVVKQANMYIANPAWFQESMVPEYQIMTGRFDDKATHMRLILDGGVV